MIRLGLPIPTLVRMQIRAQVAAQQAARRYRSARDSFTRSAASLIHRKPRPQEALIAEFGNLYDELVDLLCWSAQEGITDMHRAKYSELRRGLLRIYPPVKPHLAPHLDVTAGLEIPPCSYEVRLRGPAGSPDCFEALFAAARIDSTVDSQSLIFEMQRSRGALESYRRSMSQV